MGQIVGAAIVSHHPGLMQPEEARIKRGAGRDSDLIAGFGRIRERIDAVRPDTFIVFDSHWFTTNFHLVAGAERYAGLYTSTELPFVLSRVPYDYPGAPALAALVQEVARERQVAALNITEPTLTPQYATLNVLAMLHRGESVLSVGTCQTARMHHFLQMGGVVGEAIRRSGARAMLLASGALSHAFNDLDFTPLSPCGFDPSNVSSAENRRLDEEMIELFREGRHDRALERYPEMIAAEYEGRAAPYVQMIGALGGGRCRAPGTPCSEYESASGTGNIHIWFDVNRGAAI